MFAFLLCFLKILTTAKMHLPQNILVKFIIDKTQKFSSCTSSVACKKSSFFFTLLKINSKSVCVRMLCLVVSLVLFTRASGASYRLYGSEGCPCVGIDVSGSKKPFPSIMGNLAKSSKVETVFQSIK